MDERIRASWENVLNPQSLKTNIITASIFSMAFEMLKTSIIEKIEGFYTNGFNEQGLIISPEYATKVLALNKSRLYASLKWLENNHAINTQDLADFEFIKNCRNTLTHEMLIYASKGVDFDVSDAFNKLVALIRKIEIWWFENLDLSIDPDAYPDDLKIEEVVPGPLFSIQLLIDIALGPDDKANLYYEQFVSKFQK